MTRSLPPEYAPAMSFEQEKMKSFRRRILCGAVLGAALAPRVAAARALRSEVVVAAPGGARRTFDVDALEALGMHEFTTAGPWFPGRMPFAGPSLASVLAAVGTSGRDVRVTALNDYSAVVPASLLADGRAVLATRRRGERMSVAERGPAWVVFPYDDYPENQRPVLFPLSVWQVATLQVL